MSEDRDYESEARKEGWVPESEWKGDEAKKPAEFVDAKVFVERGEKIAGVLKSKVERLERERAADRKDIAEFREYTQAQLAKEKSEKERLLKTLEAQRAEAINESDGQTFTQLDQQINDLRSQPDPAPSSANDFDSLANAWVAQNSWYQQDQVLAAYADGIGSRIEAEGYTGQAFFDEVSRRTQETFPEKFQTSAPAAPTVDSGQVREASDPKPKSYDALPEDAQAQCDKFVETIPGFSKEEYVANYDWD